MCVSGCDAMYRRNAVSDSDGTTIAAWQFFASCTATVTPTWGDITTDHQGYDGSGRLIGKRRFNGSAVLVGNTTTYDPSGNKLYERALHDENRSNLVRAKMPENAGEIRFSLWLPGLPRCVRDKVISTYELA